MGGTIRVESEPGAGAAFFFTARLPAVASGAVMVPNGSDSVGTAARAVRLRVLVVDDITVNQEVACLLLARLGHRADVVGNGLEAIDALGRQTYDVVLMDMRMPGLDGPGATRIIRQQWRTAGPRIVAITANASPADRKALDAGMDDFLTKPITLEALAAALARSATPVPIEERPGATSQQS